MSAPQFSRRTRRLTPRLFVVVVSAFLLVVCALGWLLVRQEAELGQERRRDQLESELTRASERVEREYQALQQRLSTLETTGLQALWPTGVTVVLASDSIRYVPAGRLPYVPRVSQRAIDARLQRADRLEFANRDFSAARAVLTRLVEAGDPDIRAGALLRLARLDRKSGDESSSRARYAALTELTGASIEGVPAVWMGWYGLCSMPRLDTDTGSPECLSALARAMVAGDENVDAATYAFYRDILAGTDLPDGVTMPPQRHVLSEAVIDLDRIRLDALGGRRPESGMGLSETDSTRTVIVWKMVGERMWGVASPVEYVLERWLPSASFASAMNLKSPGADTEPVLDGNDVLTESMTVSIGGNRWRLIAAETDSMRAESGYRMRLLVLGILLALVILIVGSSMYFVSRALRQEFEVARMQSEFVAAVSHEFRTPLTSMRQLTEMLASGRVTSEERTQKYYAMLDQEASRLARLVESLLNFGRMETGRFPYNIDDVNLRELIESVIQDFEREKGRDVRLSGDVTALLPLDADMITLALWNLLDNAAKYSEADAGIDVSLSQTDGEIRVAVTDYGAGIPFSDRERIFDKFVRAEAASDTSVKGTGLGLTLVRRIMEDHDGRVELDETSDEGSTFALYFTRHDDADSDR